MRAPLAEAVIEVLVSGSGEKRLWRIVAESACKIRGWQYNAPPRKAELVSLRDRNPSDSVLFNKLIR